MSFRSIACLALTLVNTAAAAQKPQSGPMQLDVAGVRLDMTPAQAKAALIAAGYRITAENRGESFEQSVRKVADSRLGRPRTFPKGVSFTGIDAIGPRMETVDVHFVQRPDGSTVGAVWAKIPEESMTAGAFIAQAIGKYGAPGAARFNHAEMFWCAKEAGSNCGRLAAATGPDWSHYPSLRTETYFDNRIWLDIGYVARRDLDRKHEAAVEALAPKTNKATF